ncbi:hypothetical protein DXT90_03455 [Agrobacterium tumefaciens]|nr:hypothetical protein [Agrobacterium tumefaciens]
MIKLEKSEIPTVLKDNADKWLSELQSAIALGDKKAMEYRTSRYNHPKIKEAVVQETNGKCAYCEADVVATSHGDIEHIFPKSLDRTKTFEWSNLGFACEKCNQNKSNKDPNSEKIIDPYQVDPRRYINFFHGFINGGGTLEGINTIRILDLQRAELTERRKHVVETIIKSINAIKNADSVELKQAIINDFEANELGPHLEFSAMRHDFWNAFKPKFDSA